MTTKHSTFEVLEDSRINCLSAMTSMPVAEYLNMAKGAYLKRGGITGQREKLQTTSAIRIRKRMVDDVQQGAVLPPLVVGVVLPSNIFQKFRSGTTPSRRKILKEIEPDRISIIDGMQRTTALIEAFSEKSPPLDRKIRVEFWVAEDTGSLIYRMLVLNTGQVPWNLRRQIEVVFRSLILELKSSISTLEVLDTTASRRRSKGGQFQADDLIELFLVFGARKEKIDIRERLADEFTRLDFMEAAAKNDFTELYCSTLKELINFDIIFDKLKKSKAEYSDDLKKSKTEQKERFTSGKDLFSSQPACVGFITAIALDVFGRPGVTRKESEQEKKLAANIEKLSNLRTKLTQLNEDQLGEFLCLKTLSESLSRIKTSQSVGDSEREFFLKSFQVLLEEGENLESMEACWRAY